jgi:hypothetical protein
LPVQHGSEDDERSGRHETGDQPFLDVIEGAVE